MNVLALQDVQITKSTHKQLLRQASDAGSHSKICTMMLSPNV